MCVYACVSVLVRWGLEHRCHQDRPVEVIEGLRGWKVLACEREPYPTYDIRQKREREREQDKRRDRSERGEGRSRARVISKAGRKYPFLRRLTGGGGVRRIGRGWRKVTIIAVLW